MEKLKVNINPYYAYFSVRGQVFKLVHEGNIPRDFLSYSDFVIDSDGSVLKHRFPVGTPQFNRVVHKIRSNENIEEYKFNPENHQAIDLFFKRIIQQYNDFYEYRCLNN